MNDYYSILKWTIFQLYHGENKLGIDKEGNNVCLVQDQQAHAGFFVVLVYWNNSPRLNILLIRTPVQPDFALTPQASTLTIVR